MALFLQNHNIPIALADQVHGLVGTVLHKRASARSVGAVHDRVPHALGHIRNHLWQVVDFGVTVPDEQNPLGILGKNVSSKEKQGYDGGKYGDATHKIL